MCYIHQKILVLLQHFQFFKNGILNRQHPSFPALTYEPKNKMCPLVQQKNIYILQNH